jgi:hypothetical protein
MHTYSAMLGHIGEERNAYRFFVKKAEGERPPRTPRHRYGIILK